MNADAIQRAAYEAMAFLGPIASAIGAGFAIVIGADIYLTPAGERYLSRLEHRP